MSTSGDRHILDLVTEAIREIRREQEERQIQIDLLVERMRQQARRLAALPFRIVTR